jgi:hypothetical protein
VSEMTMTTERRDEALPERWSAQRKTEVVLRVVRGEALDEVAREIQVPVHEVEEWRRVFLESGRQGLKRRVARGTPRALHAARGPREDAGGGVIRTGNCPENTDRYRACIGTHSA